MISDFEWQPHQWDLPNRAPRKKAPKNSLKMKHEKYRRYIFWFSQRKKEMYFKILLKKSLKERCIPSTAHAVSSNVIDILLLRFHVLNILIQANHLILTLGREEPKQWCKTLMIFTIFYASQLQMFSKILPECLIILQCKHMLSIQKQNGIRC